MKERIPLQIIEGRLVLTAVIECKRLRVLHQIMRFVIDTGSSDSFLSDKELRRLQIPINGKQMQGLVNVGGSTFSQILLPKFKMHLLKEDKNTSLKLDVSFSALKTTKISEKKVQTAQTLPPILGLDFLREQKLSLHVILTENLAYLETE